MPICQKSDFEIRNSFGFIKSKIIASSRPQSIDFQAKISFKQTLLINPFLREMFRKCGDTRWYFEFEDARKALLLVIS